MKRTITGPEAYKTPAKPTFLPQGVADRAGVQNDFPQVPHGDAEPDLSSKEGRDR